MALLWFTAFCDKGVKLQQNEIELKHMQQCSKQQNNYINLGSVLND